MYKAIIADDEVRICILLRKLVNWEALGIEIIAECYDGPSTLQTIFDKRPDIVVSDICMPGIDGLEIVKRCNEARINCAFLLISGHAEFEYARMAIQYNVENYLLKPLNKNELEENLLEIKKKLGHNAQILSQQSHLNSQIKADKDVLRTQFLNNALLIPNWIKRDTLSTVQENFHLDLDLQGNYYTAALLCISRVPFSLDQRRLLLKRVQNNAHQIISRAGRDFVSLTLAPVLYILLRSEDFNDARDFLGMLLDSLQRRFSDYSEITIGVSERIDGIENLGVHNRAHADFALNQRFNRGNGKIYFYDRLPPPPTSQSSTTAYTSLRSVSIQPTLLGWSSSLTICLNKLPPQTQTWTHSSI